MTLLSPSNVILGAKQPEPLPTEFLPLLVDVYRYRLRKIPNNFGGYISYTPGVTSLVLPKEYYGVATYELEQLKESMLYGVTVASKRISTTLTVLKSPFEVLYTDYPYDSPLYSQWSLDTYAEYFWYSSFFYGSGQMQEVVVTADFSDLSGNVDVVLESPLGTTLSQTVTANATQLSLTYSGFAGEDYIGTWVLAMQNAGGTASMSNIKVQIKGVP